MTFLYRFFSSFLIIAAAVFDPIFTAMCGTAPSTATNPDLLRDFISKPSVVWSLKFTVRDFVLTNVDEYFVRWQTNGFYIEVTNTVRSQLIRRPPGDRRVAGFDGEEMWMEDQSLVHVLPLSVGLKISDPNAIRRKVDKFYSVEVLYVLSVGLPYERLGEIQWASNKFRFVNGTTVVRGEFISDNHGRWEGFNLSSFYGGEEYKATVKYRYAEPPLLGFLPTSWDVYLPKAGKSMEIVKTYEIESLMLTNKLLPKDFFSYSNRLAGDISGVVRYGTNRPVLQRYGQVKEKRVELLGMRVPAWGVRVCFYIATLFLGCGTFWVCKKSVVHNFM